MNSKGTQHTYTCIHSPQTSLPSRLSQNIEQTSLCYTKRPPVLTRMYVPMEMEVKLECPVRITCRLLLPWKIYNLEVFKQQKLQKQSWSVSLWLESESNLKSQRQLWRKVWLGTINNNMKECSELWMMDLWGRSVPDFYILSAITYTP